MKATKIKKGNVILHKVKFRTYKELEVFFEDNYESFSNSKMKTKAIGTTFYYWKVR